jgi:hypothetical protein
MKLQIDQRDYRRLEDLAKRQGRAVEDIAADMLHQALVERERKANWLEEWPDRSRTIPSSRRSFASARSLGWPTGSAQRSSRAGAVVFLLDTDHVSIIQRQRASALVAGKSFSGIFEVTGLDTIRRLPEQKLTITAEHVAAARKFLDTRPRRDDTAEPGKEVQDNPAQGPK